MGDLSDHFSKVELQCDCGCGFGTNDGDVDPNLILLLEGIRMEINKPVRIRPAVGAKSTMPMSEVYQIQHTPGAPLLTFMSLVVITGGRSWRLPLL